MSEDAPGEIGSTGGDDAAERGDADGDGDETAEADERGDAGAGPSVVGAWSNDATCAACGATVRRTWVAEGDRVCLDCRSW